MNDITKFSPEACAELKYYVYRLVDPRNGETFYVGKGKNNRVFAHAACALSSYSDIDYDPENDNDENLKYKTIRAIKDDGLDVIYIIQKYDLTNDEALLVESVLIDVYSLKTAKLTNSKKGYNSSEPTNALTLQRDFTKKEYVEDESFPKYIIIKVKEYFLNQCNYDRYETTRKSWRLNPNTANKYPYVLSVTNGIVKEVYKVFKWRYCSENKNSRCEFNGEIAEPNVRNLFIDKRIPEKYRKKGQSSPFLYSK